MSTIEETALSHRIEHSSELAQTGAAAEKQFEIQSAIIVARNFPRNEDAAFEKLMKACKRSAFAEDAAYSYPRGGEKVEGPSVNLAREAARVWGNIRHGVEVIRDDENSRQIRAFSWDMETNVKITAEDDFAKLIYRKKGGWQIPDERDLRELTNRRGAILKRNCILETLPKDLIENALLECKKTLQSGAQQDPDGARKKLILAFSELNVTPEMLEKKLGHPLVQCSPSEIVELRAIYKSIDDGNSKWSDYVGNGEHAATDLGEVGKKSEAPAASSPAAAAAPTDAVERGSLALPFDLSKTYHIEEMTAQKKGVFSLTLREGGHKLTCSDQRLYITAASAKQSGAAVIVEAKTDGTTITLTGLSEIEG